jgi:hypothetical protein
LLFSKYFNLQSGGRLWRALNRKLKLKLPVLLLFFGAKRVPEEQNFFCSPHSSSVKQRNIVYAIWAVDSVMIFNCPRQAFKPGNKRPVTVIDWHKYAICSVLTGTKFGG